MSKFFTTYQIWLMLATAFLVGFTGPHSQKTVVLGDIEGSWERFESFIRGNPAFEIDLIEGITLNANYKFVFMGDTVDKGPESLKILSALLELKRNYPDRVVLILGNRDINKIRLLKELSPQALQEAPNESIATQTLTDWLKEKRIGPEMYSDGPTRLKWILEKTMGASEAFEFRRQELQKQDHRAPSDQQVFESFLSDSSEQGLMGRYLQLAQLAYVDRDNRTLFVHGGLTTEAFGSVPNVKEKFTDLDKWVETLNHWAQEEIHAGLVTKNGAPKLVQYQQRIPGTRSHQGSVVYSRNFDSSHNPELIPEALQKILLAQGIDTIVVGHTPVGDFPAVISNGKFRIVFVDNSTSKESAKVTLSHGTLKVVGRSPLSDLGYEISYEHRLNEPTPIGKNTEKGLIIGSKRAKLLTYRVEKQDGLIRSHYEVQTICTILF